MEVAVLSDIHGNYVALETCVNYARERGIENFIFLGDYLGELAYPQKTMRFLYALKGKYRCWFIKGNKESYWLKYNKAWKEKDSTTGALYYTYHNLTQQDLEFDLVLMSIDAFEKREQLMRLREKILQAEQERIDGVETRSIS